MEVRTILRQKVAIVTDSIACLTRELIERYKIGIVPIRLLFQGKVYRDLVDITPTEAYKLFMQDPASFNTSPSAPGHFLEAYREASDRADSILCITLSSKLSTGYDMARMAKDQAQTEMPATRIEVLDSQTVTAAEGFVALQAAQAASEDKDLQEVTRLAAEMTSRANFFLLLDTIQYVYRTGRIPKVAAQVGSMLSIKPILTSSSGLVRFAGAVRSTERGIERIIALMKSKIGEEPVHVAVMHAYALERAQVLMERIASEVNCAELWLTEFSPVMGYACGTGTVGFAYYIDE